MKLLAIETTGTLGSFAVVDGPEVLAEINRDIMGRHVETGVDLVSEVLQQASTDLAGLDGVAVSLGPGSFTGLRVGLGIAKGLSAGTGLALAGVPTLDCLARPLGTAEGLIVPARDARRGEVYCSIYRSAGGTLERVTDYMSLAPGDLVSRIEAARGPAGERVTLVGDGLARYVDILVGTGGFESAPESFWNVRAAVVGAIGMELLSAGKALDLDTAEPIYVRPSEAERKRAGRARAEEGAGGARRRNEGNAGR
jgi:tRNA threonylcarbamoyladenosine biosynthesis protein TsaB